MTQYQTNTGVHGQIGTVGVRFGSWLDGNFPCGIGLVLYKVQDTLRHVTKLVVVCPQQNDVIVTKLCWSIIKK